MWKIVVEVSVLFFGWLVMSGLWYIATLLVMDALSPMLGVF